MEGCFVVIRLVLLAVAKDCVPVAVDDSKVTKLEVKMALVAGRAGRLPDKRQVEIMGALSRVVEAVGVIPMTVGPRSTYVEK